MSTQSATSCYASPLELVAAYEQAQALADRLKQLIDQATAAAAAPPVIERNLLDARAAAKRLGISVRSLARITIPTPQQRADLQRELAELDRAVAALPPGEEREAKQKQAANKEARLHEMHAANLAACRIGGRVLYQPDVLDAYTAGETGSRE